MLFGNWEMVKVLLMVDNQTKHLSKNCLNTLALTKHIESISKSSRLKRRLGKVFWKQVMGNQTEYSDSLQSLLQMWNKKIKLCIYWTNCPNILSQKTIGSLGSRHDMRVTTIWESPRYASRHDCNSPQYASCHNMQVATICADKVIFLF